MRVLTSTGLDIANFIPWTIALLSLLVTIYSLVKKGTKDDTTELTTVIVKLESIKDICKQTNETINDMRDDIDNLKDRVTRLEAIVDERTIAHG